MSKNPSILYKIDLSFLFLSKTWPLFKEESWFQPLHREAGTPMRAFGETFHACREVPPPPPVRVNDDAFVLSKCTRSIALSLVLALKQTAGPYW